MTTKTDKEKAILHKLEKEDNRTKNGGKQVLETTFNLWDLLYIAFFIMPTTLIFIIALVFVIAVKAS